MDNDDKPIRPKEWRTILLETAWERKTLFIFALTLCYELRRMARCLPKDTKFRPVFTRKSLERFYDVEPDFTSCQQPED